MFGFKQLDADLQAVEKELDRINIRDKEIHVKIFNILENFEARLLHVEQSMRTRKTLYLFSQEEVDEYNKLKEEKSCSESMN